MLDPQPARAQLPPCVEKKLQYPTFAQEIHEEAEGQPISSIVIADLRIEGDVHNRDTVRMRILTGLKQREFVRDPGGLDEIADSSIRGDFERRGYFEAVVSDIQAQQLDIQDQHQRMIVIAHVREGERYSAGEISVVSADPDKKLVISPLVLRQLIHLRKGQIYNADELRSGIKRISAFYAALGYIDSTIEPDPEFDHSQHSITTTLKVIEGPKYRVRSFAVNGLDIRSKSVIEASVQPGSVFDNSLIQKLFNQGRTALGRNVSSDDVIRVNRNIEKGTVDIVFDYPNCLPLSN